MRWIAERRWTIVGWFLGILLVVFLVLPTAIVIPMAFTPGRYIEFPPSGLSGHAFTALFHSSAWRASTWASVQVALLAVAVGLVAGSLAAVAVHRRSGFAARLATALIVAPIGVPLIALALAAYTFFLGHGLVGTVWSIGLTHSLLAAPYIFVTVSVSLTGLDWALVRAARSLGGGAWSLARDVYWPVIRPGVLSGAVFAFAVSLDEAVVAVFLQGPDAITLPVRMFAEVQYEFSPTLTAVSSVLIGVAALLGMVHVAVVGRGEKRARGEASSTAQARPSSRVEDVRHE